MPGQSTAPPPTRARRRMVGPFTSSWRRSVRPMKSSFVVTTQGAMKTSSSSVEYAVMYASAWIFVSAPTVVSFSTSDAPADDHVVADLDPLPDAGLVADDHTRAEPRPREDDRARGHDRAVAELRGRQVLPLRRRARRERRLLADDRAVEDLHALAEHRPRVDDRARRDLRGFAGNHAGTPASDVWSSSSVRTTASPARASAWSPGPRCTSSRKWRHSSFSGSSFEMRGLYFAPVRVCHSP